jgi:hypothetical protein
MSDSKSLSVPVNIPTDMFITAVEKAVDAQVIEIQNEFKKALSQANRFAGAFAPPWTIVFRRNGIGSTRRSTK